MCGIYGFASRHPRRSNEILEALRDLEYRGYDSWGAAVLDGAAIFVRKNVGPVPQENVIDGQTTIGIGHTRWATHGGVTKENAHPHLDEFNRFAVVHNGIVENFTELKDRLVQKRRFRSETDTEVIVHLYEEEREKQDDAFKAFRSVWSRLQGLNAVVLLDRLERRLFFGKKGSPLAIGKVDDGFSLSSDGVALAARVNFVAFLEDGWTGWLSAAECVVFSDSGKKIEPQWQDARSLSIAEVTEGSGHRMLIEMQQQPQVLRRLSVGSGRYAEAAEMIRGADEVFLLGCGTAHHAALVGESLLLKNGVRARAVLANEAAVQTRFVNEQSLVLALSQSGETIDVIEPLTQWRGQGAKVLSLTNSPSSTIERMSDLTLPLQAGREKAVASTKAFTAKLAVLSLIEAELSGHFSQGKRLVESAAQVADDWFSSPVAESVEELSQRLKIARDQFFLGRGIFWTLAREAALKVKEISYLHAEGMAAGELKHGTLALVEEGIPCFLFGSSEEQAETISTAMELKARGGYIIGVTPYESDVFDHHLPLPSEIGLPQWIVASIIGQMLAYHYAVALGRNPDRPRNLAKSVTVK